MDGRKGRSRTGVRRGLTKDSLMGGRKGRSRTGPQMTDRGLDGDWQESEAFFIKKTPSTGNDHLI